MPTEVDEGKSTRVPPSTSSPPLESEETSPVPPPPESPLLTPIERAVLPAELPASCANCATPLTGPFCSQCGQNVADYHRSVWRLLASFFDNVFGWDSKFFRTLGPLMARPGLLTQDFMAGRRVRYVHPLRLFLFTSAVCLTLLQLGFRTAPMVITSGAKDNTTDKLEEIHFNLDDDDEDATPAPSPSPDKSAPAAPGASVAPPPVSSATPAPSAAPVSPAASPAAAGGGKPVARDHSKDGAVERYFRDMGERVKRKQKAVGPAELNREISRDVQHALSWVALAMLPIFALLLRSFYWRRDSYYFVHLIFSLHYHTFLLIFWTAYKAFGAAVKWTGVGFLEFLLVLCLLVPPWYLYRSLRRLFGDSRRRTAFKVLMIGTLHLLALLIGVAIAGMTSLFATV